MFIVKYQNFFLLTAIVLVVVSFWAIFSYGLRLGIDFTGGTVMEIFYKDARPTVDVVKTKIAGSGLDLGNMVIQEAGDTNIILKMRDIKEAERAKLVEALSVGSSLEVTKFDSIGPIIGAELKQKALVAISLVCILIALYIAFAFRQVSYPVSSIKYGFAAILALFHDVVVPTGVIALMGHLYGTEVDILFVTAILAILGFSVHDTIVVFDRIRENLRNRVSKDFGETVHKSVVQTIVRSINTSMSTVFALLALYFFGGESTKLFSFILIIGIISGTYSSIFIASPILLFFEKRQKAKK